MIQNESSHNSTERCEWLMWVLKQWLSKSHSNCQRTKYQTNEHKHKNGTKVIFMGGIPWIHMGFVFRRAIRSHVLRIHQMSMYPLVEVTAFKVLGNLDQTTFSGIWLLHTRSICLNITARILSRQKYARVTQPHPPNKGSLLLEATWFDGCNVSTPGKITYSTWYSFGMSLIHQSR